MDRHHGGRLSRILTEPMCRRTALRRLGRGGMAAAVLATLGPERSGATQGDGPPPAWFEPEATSGFHGQVVMGEGPVYLSHLPMFMFNTPAKHPHHFQVILEVSFGGDGADAHGAYVQDRRGRGAPLYTLSPLDRFRMLDLISPGADRLPLRSFRGDIVRGHFERPPEQQPFGIAPAVVHENAMVNVERVVYAHEFQFQPESLTQLEYVLFGGGAELFLAHRITEAPDFDQILPARIEGRAFDEEELREGVVVEIPERANAMPERLRAGDRVAAVARRTGTGVAVAADLQIEAGQELYFEEGELRFPLTNVDFDPTGEEIAAGFGVR